MTWARIDDSMPDHPKLARLGPLRALAGWLHLCGICYASRFLTDGFVPAAQLDALLGPRLPQRPAVLAAALVRVGMWHRARGGFRIHDYLEYNPSKVETVKRRERTAARVRGYRARNADGNADGNALHKVPGRNAVTSALVRGSPTPIEASTTRNKTPGSKPPARARAKPRTGGKASASTRGPDRSSLSGDSSRGEGYPLGEIQAPAMNGTNGHARGPLAGMVGDFMQTLAARSGQPVGSIPRPEPAP